MHSILLVVFRESSDLVLLFEVLQKLLINRRPPPNRQLRYPQSRLIHHLILPLNRKSLHPLRHLNRPLKALIPRNHRDGLLPSHHLPQIPHYLPRIMRGNIGRPASADALNAVD